MANPNVLCPKCWKRDPAFASCSKCGAEGCESCLFPKAWGSEECLCLDCGGTALEPEELSEPGCICTCERVDVDVVDPRGCEVHGR